MGQSAHLVTRGIVLRETVTKEADKILTLLTEDRGKVPVIARGVRRKGSRFAACCQPLVWSEWTLYQRGGWYYVNEGSTLELFRGLRDNLEAYALASYFAELTEAVAEEEVPGPALLRHLLNGLYALSELRKPSELVKPVFELKLLSLAGYEPLLDECAYCGKEHPEEPVLDTAQGVLRCKSCGTGNRSTWKPLCAGSLEAARRAVYGDERRLYAFTLGEDALRRLDEAVEAFLAVQLERGFRTLEFYKGVRGSGGNA